MEVFKQSSKKSNCWVSVCYTQLVFIMSNTFWLQHFIVQKGILIDFQ